MALTLQDALKLPACHIFGISMGTIIALQLAIQYPKKVLSLFMVSCLGLPEVRNHTQTRKPLLTFFTAPGSRGGPPRNRRLLDRRAEKL